MLASPNGVPRESAKGNDFLGQRVVTEDGLVHLAPERFLAAADKLEADFAAEQDSGDDEFRLITRRAHRTHNSWTLNVTELAQKSEDQTNYLYMNPADADRVGLANGDVADVTSKVATVRLPIRFLASDQRAKCGSCTGNYGLPKGRPRMVMAISTSVTFRRTAFTRSTRRARYRSSSNHRTTRTA